MKKRRDYWYFEFGYPRPAVIKVGKLGKGVKKKAKQLARKEGKIGKGVPLNE